MAPRDNDLDTMNEAELLVLPASIIPSGSLTKFWALHASALQKENVDELARELTGASRSRRLVGGAQGADEREEEREHRYEQALRQVRERENLLLARLEEEERVIEKLRQEIDDNAIRLHDGRLVYVDGKRYRDGQGRVLEGDDEGEARQQHGTRPTAATWQEKSDADRRWEELQRMRRDIEQGRSHEGQGTRADRDANVQEREAAVKRDEEALAQNSQIKTAVLEANADEGAYNLDYSAPVSTGKGTNGKAGGTDEGLRSIFAANTRPAEPGPATLPAADSAPPARRAGVLPPRNG